jgi:hypothetical protein
MPPPTSTPATPSVPPTSAPVKASEVLLVEARGVVATGSVATAAGVVLPLLDEMLGTVGTVAQLYVQSAAVAVCALAVVAMPNPPANTTPSDIATLISAVFTLVPST